MKLFVTILFCFQTDWNKRFLVVYSFEERQELKFEIYNTTSESTRYLYANI